MLNRREFLKRLGALFLVTAIPIRVPEQPPEPRTIECGGAIDGGGSWSFITTTTDIVLEPLAGGRMRCSFGICGFTGTIDWVKGG